MSVAELRKALRLLDKLLQEGRSEDEQRLLSSLQKWLAAYLEPRQNFPEEDLYPFLEPRRGFAQYLERNFSRMDFLLSSISKTVDEAMKSRCPYCGSDLEWLVADTPTPSTKKDMFLICKDSLAYHDGKGEPKPKWAIGYENNKVVGDKQ
jgi:hypothetical protein